LKEIRDVPLGGVIIEEGEPLCSIVISGKNRQKILQKAKKMAETIYDTLQIF
jgi:predicted ATP-grasp superfamily ATP-dependent carboligase